MLKEQIRFWLAASAALGPAIKKHGAKEVWNFCVSGILDGNLISKTQKYLDEMRRERNDESGHIKQVKLQAEENAPRFALDSNGLSSHIANQHEKLRRQSKPRDRQWVLAFLISCDERASLDKIAITLNSIALLHDLPSSTSVVLAGEVPLDTLRQRFSGLRISSVRDFNAARVSIDASAFVLHLFAGDTVYGTAFQVLRDVDLLAADLWSFNGYQLMEDGLYDISVQLAADPIHLYNCNAIFSRFIARATLLCETKVTEGEDSQSYGFLKCVISNLIEIDREHRFQHLAVPLVEIHNLAEERIAEREKIVLNKRQFAFPASSTVRTSGPSDIPPVSVVIPTKNKGHLLHGVVDALLSNPLVDRIVIIAHDVTDMNTLATLSWAHEFENVRIVDYKDPFNFSRMNNIGASFCRTQNILFLNDDIAFFDANWLKELLKPFVDGKTAAAGMLLLYPNERVQHAGMYLGFNNTAGHILRNYRLPEQDFGLVGIAPRQVSCVTGAALMVDRLKFDAVNGFDEQFAHYIQDVDLCLRLIENGWRIVFQPGAKALHMESVSTKERPMSPAVIQQRGNEHQRFMRRWKSRVYDDPWLSNVVAYQDEMLRTFNV